MAGLPDPSAVRVAAIDPALADTAAFCAAYDVAPEASANCVVVEARRGEVSTVAAVLVLAIDRADINRVVRHHLGARKISFADLGRVEQLTGMQSGGITPIGLPPEWPVLVDEAVRAADAVVIGAGIRGAKLLIGGRVLAGLPAATVLSLAVPRAGS
ncbi:MAG: YbaK/EbsC family protein [Terracoccus sp.]